MKKQSRLEIELAAMPQFASEIHRDVGLMQYTFATDETRIFTDKMYKKSVHVRVSSEMQ